jgi:Protein of unknown function (DUF2510)
MFEYDSVSASAYDATSLVGKLNEKASDGWEVVSIVPTGGEVTAFLRRTASAGSDGQAAAGSEAEGAVAAAGIAAVAPVSEPAGWASEPDTKAADEIPSSTESTWAAGAATGAAAAEAATEPEAPSTPEPLAAEPVASEPEPTPVPEPEPVAAAAPAAPAAAAASVPTTPAGWYPDPSGRYEMRYWDGDKWTEHVSRQGQTYTDPPVA